MTITTYTRSAISYEVIEANFGPIFISEVEFSKANLDENQEPTKANKRGAELLRRFYGQTRG